MNAHIANGAFEFVGEIHDFGHTGVFVHLGAELGHIVYAVFHSRLQLLVWAVGVGRHMLWNELCEHIRCRGRIAHHTCHVFYGRFGGHCAVGDDVGHVCGAVALGDVV